VYKIKTGGRLNLKNPTTFCDKQNWLKLHDIHSEYTQLVDKIGVREHIAQVLGEEFLFPVYGVWEKFDDIDFEQLPEKFVLKCNHDSGSVKVITDKAVMDRNELKKFFDARMKMNSYVFGREYPYKDVKPLIFAEKYMTPDNAEDINDYKFFCFNGKPEIMFIATERSTDVKFDFFDMDFNHLDIIRSHPNSDKPISKPEKFDELKVIATKLASQKKFVRIDLYDINDQIYFGEYTFFPGGGFQLFQPPQWEKQLGDWINLP
jgi:hypothetical protein